MPVPTRVLPEKNIWVAAGDGDLERVRELVTHHGLSPNVPDPNTYTPMHAAASYGQHRVLDYLISQGGDVNVTDSDGDTPLFVVEDVDTAKYLIEHGANVHHHNLENLTAAEALEEDSPDVAAYIRSLNASSTNSISSQSPETQHVPSQHAQNAASEQLTSSLLQSVQGIMERAEAEGRDPDEELREAVGRTVLQGIVTGYTMSTEGTDDRLDGREEQNGAKRPRNGGDPS